MLKAFHISDTILRIISIKINSFNFYSNLKRLVLYYSDLKDNETEAQNDLGTCLMSHSQQGTAGIHAIGCRVYAFNLHAVLNIS